jgi:hypothetical protein
MHFEFRENHKYTDNLAFFVCLVRDLRTRHRAKFFLCFDLSFFFADGSKDNIGDFVSVESRTHLRLSLPCGADAATELRRRRRRRHYARGDGSGIDFPVDSTTTERMLLSCFYP